MQNEPENKPFLSEEGDASNSYQSVGGFVLEVIKIIILAFVIIFPIRVFLFQPFFVQGASMEPNFEDGQYLIVNEFGVKETDFSFNSHELLKIDPFKEIPRQRVVVFRYPLDTTKFFIKRVIGLPGETVKVKDGQVTIFNAAHPDGFVLDEKSYLPVGLKTAGDLTITLSDKQYFMLGDNRMFSSDSRVWGPVPTSDIVGEVALRAWPLDKISIF